MSNFMERVSVETVRLINEYFGEGQRRYLSEETYRGLVARARAESLVRYVDEPVPYALTDLGRAAVTGR